MQGKEVDHIPHTPIPTRLVGNKLCMEKKGFKKDEEAS
jgi:hypothetical protein